MPSFNNNSSNNSDPSYSQSPYAMRHDDRSGEEIYQSRSAPFSTLPSTTTPPNQSSSPQLHPSRRSSQQQQQQQQQQQGSSLPRPRHQSVVASDNQLGGPLLVNNAQLHRHQQQASLQHLQQQHLQQYQRRQDQLRQQDHLRQQEVQRHHEQQQSQRQQQAAYQHISQSTSTYPYPPPPIPQQQQQQRLRPIAPAPPVTSVGASSNFATQPTRLQHQQAAAAATYSANLSATSSSSSQSGPTTPTTAPTAAAAAPVNSNIYANNFPNNISPSLHPQFRAKAVCRLTCKSCLSDVCMRGMKAILLADSRIELYSTDRPPKGVQLVYDDYRTRNCKCRIRDVACLGCGNTLGYHVTQPCESCLEACNNGHFWMFHSDGVSCTKRYLPKTSSTAATIAAAAIAAAFGSSSSSSPSSSSSASSSSRGSRQRAGSRRRRRRTAVVQDLSFRRRTSIHDIEYNNAVGAGPSSSTSSTNGEEDLYNDMDGENEDYNSFGDDNEEDEEDENAEEMEMEEEKPVVMLWAALHAQEERYLQQMQQQLIIQQQQQQQWHRLLFQQQQQQESEEQALPNAQNDQQQQARPVHLLVPAITPPTVGSRYHSMISSAISNASMMLWDEGRSQNQYEQLCR
ncbi:Protein fam72a [Linnemannia gamsii]|uniref:Protein fam72a n=1 Tax=Linnemannia gamsii TaxID=64522 RepID=A0ABQ7K7W0_9FUNG|nr:Protein fam72a [Linnemannia gamsii]